VLDLGDVRGDQLLTPGTQVTQPAPGLIHRLGNIAAQLGGQPGDQTASFSSVLSNVRSSLRLAPTVTNLDWDGGPSGKVKVEGRTVYVRRASGRLVTKEFSMEHPRRVEEEIVPDDLQKIGCSTSIHPRTVGSDGHDLAVRRLSATHWHAAIPAACRASERSSLTHGQPPLLEIASNEAGRFDRVGLVVLW
jgi:hypothetical protein